MITEILEEKSVIFGDVITTKISEEKLNKLKDLFSGGLYSNPYSWLVELVQNARDSHRRVGTDKKVEIRFGYDNRYFITIKDFGEGMSPYTVEKVLAVYGESTKDNNIEDIGGKGIGFFSLATYTDKAYIETIHNGTKYSYLFNKNNGGQFIPLYQEETRDTNGTTVKIYLKDDWGEENEIKNQINKLLVYFDCVDFETLKSPLYKHELFWYSDDFKGHNKIHISYAGYFYEFPKEVGINNILSYPLAIPMDITELETTASREGLKLNSKSVALIKNKYENLVEYLKSKIKLEFDDLLEYLDVRNTGVFTLIPDTNLRFKYSDFELKNKIVYKPLEYLEITDLCITDTVLKIDKKTLVKSKVNIENLKSVYSKDNIKLLSKKYIKDYLQNAKVIQTKFSLKEWVSFLNLNRYPVHEWRKRINFYTDWVKANLEIKDIKDVENSQEFKDFVAKQKSTFVRNINEKRTDLYKIARWSLNKERQIVWENRTLSAESFEKCIIVSKICDEKRLGSLMFISSILNIPLVCGKKEDLSKLPLEALSVYASLKLSVFVDNNSSLVSFIKAVFPTKYEYKILKYNYHLSNKSNINDVLELLKELCLNNNYSFIEQEEFIVLTEITKYLEDNFHLKLINNIRDYTYYLQDDFIKLHNYITNLKIKNDY